jgi:hypothetical protein
MPIKEEADIGNAVRVQLNINSLDLKKMFGSDQHLILAM